MRTCHVHHYVTSSDWSSYAVLHSPRIGRYVLGLFIEIPSLLDNFPLIQVPHSGYPGFAIPYRYPYPICGKVVMRDVSILNVYSNPGVSSIHETGKYSLVASPTR